MGRVIALKDLKSTILNLQSSISFHNHGGRKRQVGLRAIVDEIIRILRVYLKSINKAISFMI
jgi:hypothetical protein